MATANNTPASGVKPARKTTSAKARSRSTASKATRAKSARTRAANQTASAVRQSQLASRDTAEVFGEYAERAVLIPVGAALIARDRVVSSVSDTISSYSSPTRAQAQLKRFERRGATARNRLEREVRKTRVRVERKLRQRRRVIEKSVEKSVSDLDARREAVAKNGSEFASRVPELANRVQERLLSLV
jgi:hypothetical protein